MAKKKNPSSSKELESMLASQLIQFNEGQRLPSIRELAGLTGMSIGAVSKALNSLEQSGAVTIERRGRLGSVVMALSLGELWDRIEAVPLVIAMTLPMHRRFEGLVTGVKMALERAGIAAYLIFIRGSRTRLKALRENRCHVAIVSGLAADELCTPEQETMLTLPPRSWLADYYIFYRASLTENPGLQRVAVDPDSFDHKRLTELEFSRQEVVYRSTPFVQFPRLLKNGEVDAVMWTSDQEEAFTGAGILRRPLSKQVMDLVGEKSISAAFIARRGNEVMRAILEATIKAEEIMEIQKRVVSGELIPEY